jgi:hypothetical protein
MKKILCLFGALSLMLTSCSSDDSNSDDSGSSSTNSVLVKKTTSTMTNSAWSSIFTYSGNKLATIKYSDGDSETYTYTGDLITKYEYFEGNSTKADNTTTYTYDASSNLISQTTADLSGGVYKTVYTKNTDGTISYVQYSGDATTQTNIQASGKFFLINNDVAKVERYNSDGSTYKSTTFTYDDKNNAIGNVTGFSKIGFALFEDFNGISHNTITEVESYPSYPNQNSTCTYKYTYDDKGFPATVTSTRTFVGNKDEVTTIQFSY